MPAVVHLLTNVPAPLEVACVSALAAIFVLSAALRLVVAGLKEYRKHEDWLTDHRVRQAIYAYLVAVETRGRGRPTWICDLPLSAVSSTHTSSPLPTTEPARLSGSSEVVDASPTPEG